MLELSCVGIKRCTNKNVAYEATGFSHASFKHRSSSRERPAGIISRILALDVETTKGGRRLASSIQSCESFAEFFEGVA